MNDRQISILRHSLTPVGDAPPLRRLNGFGFTMLGHFEDKKLVPGFYSFWCFTCLFVIVIPLRIYFVSHPGYNTDIYRFHARISMRDFRTAYPGGLGALARTIAVQIAAQFLLVIAALFALSMVFSAFRRR